MTVSSSAPAIDQLQAQIDMLEAGRRHDAGQPVGTIGVPDRGSRVVRLHAGR